MLTLLLQVASFTLPLLVVVAVAEAGFLPYTYSSHAYPRYPGLGLYGYRGRGYYPALYPGGGAQQLLPAVARQQETHLPDPVLAPSSDPAVPAAVTPAVSAVPAAVIPAVPAKVTPAAAPVPQPVFSLGSVEARVEPLPYPAATAPLPSIAAPPPAVAAPTLAAAASPPAATAPLPAAAAPLPAAAAPLPAVLPGPASSSLQWHAQDEAGRLEYGYSNQNSARHEVGVAVQYNTVQYSTVCTGGRGGVQRAGQLQLARPGQYSAVM